MSDSLISQSFAKTQKKRNFKNIRNFNCLYELRAQSKKLRDMQEKYKIGDGRVKDRFINPRGVPS